LTNETTSLLGLTVPEFTAAMTSNKTFQLSDYRGKKLVIYFYPKDNTPGCTTESIDFRNKYAEFVAHNTEIIGVSRDSLKSHENFKAKLEMPFELISDADETLCTMFNVMKMKNMYGKKVRGVERSTFVIDESGTLIKEWRGIRVPGHIDEVIQFIQAH
jgi:peroxiredoxin Q/BCP